MRGLIVDYCGVLDGVEEDRRRWRKLLTAARDNDLTTAILSNDPGGPAAAPIRQWKEGGYVDEVFLSGEIGAEKPKEEAFDLVAEKLELQKDELVMVDDSIVNVKGAVDAGMVGVYYQQFDRAVVELCVLLGLEGDF